MSIQQRNLLTTILLVGSFLALMIGIVYRTDQAAKQRVQSVCDQYRVTNSKDDYKACGAAQDSYHAEYICNSTASNCWVELK